jgi:glutamyl-tRNA reductase
MDINKFCVAGINYRKAHAVMRGLFAVNNEQYASLLFLASSYGMNEVFVLSTCNRTEIYGFTDNSDDLISLLCSQTKGDAETFRKSAYIKRGEEAIEHIFSVGAGLDSQILGDYEIVGQLKTAAKFAKQYGFMGANLERLVNSVLQSSKLVKNQTELSGGTVSLSFAAVQYIRRYVKNVRDKKILLLGIGKIGRNTCKNLVDYLDTTNITLINRSREKALELAKELNLRSASLANLAEEITAADIILAATNSNEPVILESHLKEAGDKLIIDLSIPYNVEEAAGNLPNIQMINVDELSKLKDKTLTKRAAEIPKAKAIIRNCIEEFYNWHAMRKHVPMLKDLKTKLKEIHSHSINLHTTPSCDRTLDIKIQRVLNETAGKIKMDNQRGCQYISAINEFMRTA